MDRSEVTKEKLSEAFEADDIQALDGEILLPEAKEAPDFAPGVGEPSDHGAAAEAYARAREDLTPLRVLHVFTGLPGGGETFAIARLLPALAAENFDQRVVLGRDAALAAELEAEEIGTLSLPFRRWFDFTSPVKLLAATKEFAPDIIFCWSKDALKRVLKFDRYIGSARIVARLPMGGDPKDYLGADHLIAEGRQALRRATAEGWDPAQIHYLPPLVMGVISDEASREAMALPGEGDLLMAAGDFVSESGFDTLITALQKLNSCHLILIGKGPQGARLKALARRLGVAQKVTMTGGFDGLATYYALADLVVVPARKDNSGQRVLEAWAQAKPVVAIASEAARTLIKVGKTGYLAPLEDPLSLARVIDGLLNDPMSFDRVARGGRKAFEADYGPTKVITAWRDALNWICGRTIPLEHPLEVNPDENPEGIGIIPDEDTPSAEV